MPRPHHRFLTPTFLYNRAEIMRAAWAQAFGNRKAFPRSLRMVWELARAERASLAWYAAADLATAAMRAGRPAPVLSALEAAESALLLAEHNDTVRGFEIVARARVRLASLQAAA